MLWRLTAAYAAALLASPAAALPIAALLVFVPSRRWPELGLLPALLLAAGLGVLDRAPRRGPLPGGGIAVEAEGSIASTPEARGRGSRALIEIESLGARGLQPKGWRRARVRLAWRGPLPPYGTRVAVRGTLHPARPQRNFGLDGEATALAASGAVAVLEADALQLLPGARGPTWRRALLEPLRSRLRGALRTPLAPREAGLLEALVVGARDGVDVATADAWAALGVNHILSISGMHVALLAAAVLAVAGGPRRRRGLVLLVAAVWGYAAVGGLGPTVLRAGLMTTWAALAVYLGRARAPFLGLGIASVALVWTSPERGHDLGLQLSCLATAGLLSVAPAAARGARALAARGPCGRILAWALGGSAIGLAAQAATLPLQLAHFGAVSWCAPLANLVLVPLSDAALVLALAGAPIALVSEALGRPLLLLSGALTYATCEIAARASAALELRFFPRVDSVTLGAAWCLAVGALGAAAAASRMMRRVAVIAGGVALVALAVLVVAGTRVASAPWCLEALDVGQGDSLVLTVGRSTWVVDTGDARPVDNGARVVVPHLRRAGVRRVHGLVLTHPHDDHCGGAASLLRALPVDTLYIAAASSGDSIYVRLRSRFPQVPVRELRRGDRLELGPGYTATVLWPERNDVLRSGPNGCSLVLWAHGEAGPDALLEGDLEAAGEARLLEVARLELACIGDATLVLKAAHHGSDTSSTALFLAAVRPDVALVSVGARNRYGHPGRRALADLERQGCQLLRTDRGGAVRIERRGDVLWLHRPATRARALEARPVDAGGASP